MYEFEQYKNNLDVIDKYSINNITVNKHFIYNGQVDLIKDQQNVEESKPYRPLATAVLGLKNTAAPLPTKLKFYNAWTDIDAQELFLGSKPRCYLILSKPGAQAFSLGESISKKLNCIHLCPRNVIIDELDQKSSTGNCIDFNMKHNSVCKFNHILTIIKMKLDSPAVKHRGYVISGLPLVPSSRDLQYLSNTLNGEESVLTIDDLMYDIIYNLKRKKSNVRKEALASHTTLSSNIDEEAVDAEEIEEEKEENDVEAEEEPPVELPKFILNPCSDVIHLEKPYLLTKQIVLLKQLEELFNLETQSPLIIYITCPDKDLVTKRSHKYLNYMNGLNTFEPFVLKPTADVRWPTKYTISDYISPHDTHVFNPKYNCRQPNNFREISEQQICNYKKYILNYIEEQIKAIHPQFVIKLDGRTSVHEMMYHLMERLVLLSIPPVIIPEPLYLEDPSEDMDEFWKQIEELHVIHSGTVSFNRYASPWLNRCPVQLKKRQSVKGNPRLAVKFFKHVYVLSSLDAMISFCRNPRPFLKLRYLEPTCRIIVIGTKSVGKTMVSKCLSWIFDSCIICFRTFLENEKQKKFESIAKTILSEIIATIEDTRFAKWQSAEVKRASLLKIWCESNLKLLKEYIELNEVNISDLSDFKLLNELEIERTNYLREQLYFIPIIEDLELCKNMLNNNTMADYAPIDLKTIIEKPKIPILGDEDVSEAISAYILANELQKEIEPSTEEIINAIIQEITSIDLKCQKATDNENMYGKFIIDGFPIDPEYWGYLIEANLLPDNTIAIIENKEIDQEVLHNYAVIEKSMKNYQERFILANDDLIKIKLQTATLPDTNFLDVSIIIHDFFAHLLDSLFIIEEKSSDPEASPELLTSLSESIDKFKEDWDSLKLKLEENSKSFIEVELENKSDIQIMEEVLLKLRKSYYLSSEANEDEDHDDDNDIPKDILTYNSPQYLCETNIYCPIAYYDYGVLWEGRSEFSIKYNNRLHYFSKEECSELFQKDVTKYQSYDKPFKKLPPVKICVIGCIGSGKTTVSKQIAKELGLLHIDFSEIVNDYLMPRHFKKVGRKYENSFTDVPIDEETVVEFQMDEENENVVSDILSNETELRRMVYNYFERGSPILSVLMQKFIKQIWFESSFSTNGFILDGYPRLSNDVEDMIATFCIPDLILELESSSESAVDRLSPVMFKSWKMQLNEAKQKARVKYENEQKEWMHFITKTIVPKLIYEEILNNIFLSTNEPEKVLSNSSVIMDANPSGSTNVDTHLFNAFNELVQEYPEPIDQSVWENPDEVHERIDSRIEGIYEIDDENIQNLKNILEEHKIKTITINAAKPANKVVRVALSKLTALRSRCQSFFEQTFIISMDIAEMLILEGFCFLSKFYRICPVYVFENPDSILNPYKVNGRRDKIFPVVHRCYIYFINGEEFVKKFRTNPLKYIQSNAIKSFITYPLRISIIGPPKSGKSALAEKIAKRYGLQCISRGKALRKIMEDMHWTELASKMVCALRRGEKIDFDLVMKAVHTVAIDHHTLTQGCIFDGFPELPSEAVELCKYGLYPNIVFDISTNQENILENSQNEIYLNIIKIMPPFSRPFIEDRFMSWHDKSYAIRDWINSDYQNIHILNGSDSRWKCLRDAQNKLTVIIKKINYYLTNYHTHIVPVDAMCISNEIFQKNMSVYKNYCPRCLRQNILEHSNFPVDRKGVVQYRNKFYWVCSKHMDIVLKNPYICLITQKGEIPDIAAPVKTIDMSLVYENGVCLVTYAENLPAQKIATGSNKYAANYKGKIYLFCNEDCLKKFIAKPHMYHDIVVFKETTLFPQVTLKKLPIIGYLEQTIGNIITEACCSVNVARPKYPGLSIPLSGILYIALYLKTHNPSTDKCMLPMFIKALKTYDVRSKLIIDVGLRLRSMDNPFAKYPKCDHSTNNFETESLHESLSISSSTGISLSFKISENNF